MIQHNRGRRQPDRRSRSERREDGIMPWMSIIVWLITFLVSKSSGASNGKAALMATGAGLATYYLADPVNKDNVLGISFGDGKATPGSPTTTLPGATVDTSALGSFGRTAVSEVGSTLRSWGPTGTLGVVAGTAALTSGTSSKYKKYIPWAIGLGALYILKR